MGLADTGTIGEESVDEAIGEAGAGNTESESDDDDPEATKRYWEAKRRKEGVKKVGVMCRDMFVIRHALYCFFY